jgi:hypothetical protein
MLCSIMQRYALTRELVHFITEKPCANLPAPGNERLPGLRPQAGPCGVVGEVDHHKLGARLDQRLQNKCMQS